MDPMRAERLSAALSNDVKPEEEAFGNRPLLQSGRPLLPPGVPQQFVPIRSVKPAGATLVYQPMLLGAAQVRFADSKLRVDLVHDLTVLAPISDGAIAVDWDHSVEANVVLSDLEQSPSEGSQFGTLPTAAGKVNGYAVWNKDFSTWVYRTQMLDIFKSPATKEVSQPGETERDFRVRLQQTGRERRDKDADVLRQKYPQNSGPRG